MNKIMKIGFMAFSLILLSNLNATAQRRDSDKKEKESEDKQETTAKPKTKQSTDKYFDESGGFKHRLQYGIHTNSGLLSFFNGSFNLRLEPSVGYKINNWAMAGLTGGIEYQREKYTAEVLQATVFNYGLYGRLKAFKSFYLHMDYRAVTGKFSLKTIGTDTKVTEKDSYKPEANVGIAYRSGNGVWGYEIMGVYNVNHVDGDTRTVSNKSYSFRSSPFDLKIGFTYNF